MRESVSISISTRLKKKLDQAASRGQLHRSDIVREALDEYFSRRDLEEIRRRMVPLAEAKGIYTDEDVFKEIS